MRACGPGEFLDNGFLSATRVGLGRAPVAQCGGDRHYCSHLISVRWHPAQLKGNSSRAHRMGGRAASIKWNGGSPVRRYYSMSRDADRTCM